MRSASTMSHTGGPTVRAALATAASLVLVAALGACSDDGSDPEGSGPSDETSEAAPSIPTRATIGKVSGRLERDRRKGLRKRVTRAVDAWIDPAYVEGDYPRTDFSDAFAAFSKDAAKLAKHDRRLMSNAEVGDRVESVTAKTRRLSIDVLANAGRAAAVTGRFVLVLKMDGEVRRTDRIEGSLFLGHSRKGWQVFGYDVKRGTIK
jgi:hypothetical protein